MSSIDVIDDFHIVVLVILFELILLDNYRVSVSNSP